MTPLTLAWGWYTSGTLSSYFLYDALCEWADGDPCRVAVSHVLTALKDKLLPGDGLQHNYMLSKIPSFLLQHLEAIAHSK